MSLEALDKMLHRLTYMEMRELSGQLCSKLDVSIYPEKLAAALLDLKVQASVSRSDEEKITKQVFKRKRTIAIEQVGTGWETTIPTIPGTTIRSSSLHDAVSGSIDAAVSLKAMGILK